MIIAPKFSLVVVEGGPKALQKFKKVQSYVRLRLVFFTSSLTFAIEIAAYVASYRLESKHRDSKQIKHWRRTVFIIIIALFFVSRTKVCSLSCTPAQLNHFYQEDDDNDAAVATTTSGVGDGAAGGDDADADDDDDDDDKQANDGAANGYCVVSLFFYAMNRTAEF